MQEREQYITAWVKLQSASINWNIALKLDPEYDEVRDILEALKSNKLKSADLQE